MKLFVGVVGVAVGFGLLTVGVLGWWFRRRLLHHHADHGEVSQLWRHEHIRERRDDA
jgi:hypothetical protein